MNKTHVSLQINIPSEWLVTKQTNKFLDIQATVLDVHATTIPMNAIVIYDKITTTELTMFSFKVDKMHEIIESIDDLCRQEAFRIESGNENDQALYYEIAQYGI